MTHDAYSTKRVTVWSQERDGKSGYAIKYQDGYISWCPAEVYERDYHPLGRMSFGEALHALKAGHRVARSGWNGKNMFIYLNKGSVDDSSLGEHSLLIEGVQQELFEYGDKGTVTRLPNINMRSASGSTVTGWLPSTTDMLAEDWTIL